jgi:hypothetical protein
MLRAKVWDFLVRFRTWLVNTGFMLLLFVPDVVNQPQLLAVIPQGYHKYVVAAAFVINIWLRPRPAARAKDQQ